MLPGLYQCGGLFNQVVHAFIEMPEALVLRLAAMESHINLLQYGRQFEECEHFVIVNERKVASGFFGVAAKKLIASEPAGLRSDRRLGSSRIAGLRPVTEDESEIHQWIADGGHLPIEHRLDPARVARVQHQIV